MCYTNLDVVVEVGLENVGNYSIFYLSSTIHNT